MKILAPTIAIPNSVFTLGVAPTAVSTPTLESRALHVLEGISNKYMTDFAARARCVTKVGHMSVQTSNKIEHPALLSQHSHSPPEFVTGFFPPQRKSMSRSETIRPYSLEPGLSSSTELKPTLRHGLVFPAPFTLGVKNKHTTNIMNPALVRDNLRDPCTAAEYRFLETSPRCDVCVCVCVCVWALAQSGVRQALGRGNENNKLLLRSHVSHARRREDAWYVNQSTILHSLFRAYCLPSPMHMFLA